METRADRIRYVRAIVLGLTQVEFAKLLGVSRGAVGNWERDKGIKFENLVLVAGKTGATLIWLSTGEGEAPIPDGSVVPRGLGATELPDLPEPKIKEAIVVAIEETYGALKSRPTEDQVAAIMAESLKVLQARQVLAHRQGRTLAVPKPTATPGPQTPNNPRYRRR